MYKNFFKRGIDLIGSLIGLLLLSPVFIIVTLTLFFANEGKPFFFQIRPGKNGRLFKIIKFKTMTDKQDSNGNLLNDSERLTKTGTFVRKTSLDEIPQLLNVLLGEMSLIGPRPLLVEYLPLYSSVQNRRHELRPGITGWAQVNGRNAISWENKFEHDVWYVNNCSFILDCKIIAISIKKVFLAENISANDNVTMDEFKGN
jgi:undecaprenyl phosphate N,N'-diacetylbacillosamine 1-phosphate transferase